MDNTGINKEEFELKMFTPKLTLREFCVKLELASMNVSEVEKLLDLPKRYIASKILRKTWFWYFAGRYPDRFRVSRKGVTVNKPNTKDSYLTTVRIPCMNCGGAVAVTYETDKGMPRGMKKRCTGCNNTARSFAPMNDQPVFGA